MKDYMLQDRMPDYAISRQDILELVRESDSIPLIEYKKYNRDAKYGQYRYETRFALLVYDNDGEIERYNVFHARLLIKHSSSGKKYLHDVMEIKKETSKSCQA